MVVLIRWLEVMMQTCLRLHNTAYLSGHERFYISVTFLILFIPTLLPRGEEGSLAWLFCFQLTLDSCQS